MTLNDVWFFLFILIIAGYLILDGFDMGVGILLLPLARTDTERRTFLNSIGPIWDGNEGSFGFESRVAWTALLLEELVFPRCRMYCTVAVLVLVLVFLSSSGMGQ